MSARRSIALASPPAALLALGFCATIAITFWSGFQFKRCPVCHSRRSQFLRYGRLHAEEAFSIHRCKSCLARFVIADGASHRLEASKWAQEAPPST